MPWRAVIENPPVQRGTRFACAVIFFSETEKKEPQLLECDGTLANLTVICRTLVATFDTSATTAKSELQPGLELDLTPLAPPIVVPPTKEELAKQAYLVGRFALSRLQQSQAAGMPVDAGALDALLKTTQAAYLPEYDA